MYTRILYPLTSTIKPLFTVPLLTVSLHLTGLVPIPLNYLNTIEPLLTMSYLPRTLFPPRGPVNRSFTVI